MLQGDVSEKQAGHKWSACTLLQRGIGEGQEKRRGFRAADRRFAAAQPTAQTTQASL